MVVLCGDDSVMWWEMVVKGAGKEWCWCGVAVVMV